MVFVSIIGFVNVKPRSHESTLSKNMSFKKIEPFARNAVLSDSCTATPNDKHNYFDTTVNSDLNDTITSQLPSNATNNYTPVCMENSTAPKLTVFQSPL